MATVTGAPLLNNSNKKEVYEGYLCGVFWLRQHVVSYFLTNDKKIISLLKVENTYLKKT
jgi:hypothetical protein